MLTTVIHPSTDFTPDTLVLSTILQQLRWPQTGRSTCIEYRTSNTGHLIESRLVSLLSHIAPLQLTVISISIPKYPQLDSQPRAEYQPRKRLSGPIDDNPFDGLTALPFACSDQLLSHTTHTPVDSESRPGQGPHGAGAGPRASTWALVQIGSQDGGEQVYFFRSLGFARGHVSFHSVIPPLPVGGPAAARDSPSVLPPGRGAAASWPVVEFHRPEPAPTSLRAGASSPVRRAPSMVSGRGKCHPNWPRQAVDHRVFGEVIVCSPR